MICLSCAEACRGDLCPGCLGTLSPAPDRYLGGVLVRSAYAHDGAARRLVHRLKYGAIESVAKTLAVGMAAILPPDATCLVPVRRVVARRWRHGVDPALELAGALGRLTDLPVTDVLRPAWWVARRAGPARSRRGVPRFGVRWHPADGAVLVDDVVTTGTTLGIAGRALGVHVAVTATAAVKAHPSRELRP